MKTLLKTIFPLLLLGFDHLAFGQLKPLEERFAWPLPFSLQDLNKFKEHSVTTISYLPDALIEQKGSKPKIRTFYYFNELPKRINNFSILQVYNLIFSSTLNNVDVLG